MSGTMDSYAGLLDYLRALSENPAAASYGGLPAQLVAPGSAPAPALPPQPARPTATVVSTPDETLPLPPQFMSPEEAAGSGSPVVSPSLASRTPSESSSPFAISREEQQALDRLMAFGAALASAEGKSSVAAAGDAFQALARQGAAQRQEGRQERELDINAAYREAQMEVARAEQAARENPDSPANMARLLSARADMMRAEAAMANAGRERQGSYINLMRPDGSYIAFNTTTGRQVDLPGSPLAAANATRRATQSDLSAIERAGTAAAQQYRQEIQASGRFVPPDQLQRESEARAQAARLRVAHALDVDPAIVERLTQGTTAPTAPSGNRVTVQY